MNRLSLPVRWIAIPFGCLALVLVPPARAEDRPAPRVYDNRLAPIVDPKPLLADHPQYVEPVRETRRFLAPILVDDRDADLSVRAWRYSYNARGIIEMPNRLRAAETAVIVVHPWGVNDGQGWRIPEPTGVVGFGTPEKAQLGARHARQIINPLLKSMRGKVGLVMYSLPGDEDPIRKKMYRSFTSKPTEEERVAGAKELLDKLSRFNYRGEAVPAELKLSADRPVVDYFRQFPGIDAGPRYNGPGFWNLPIPVTKNIDLDPDDVVIYDAPGYKPLREFLQKQGIRHILLTGYNTDMCFCKTTAGYENLSRDFNVFLVGDATLATFPANLDPRCATNASISYAALEHLITQVSWIKLDTAKP
jgi:hypothetical protein